MTHHDNKDKQNNKETREGVKGDIIDQTGVDQGAQELPAQPSAVVEFTEKELDKLEDMAKVEGEEDDDGEEDTGKKGKKGKGKKESAAATAAKEEGSEPTGTIYKARYNSELAKNKDKYRCGNCRMPMSVSGDVTAVPIKGKKIPKNEKGEYRYRSPGASKDGELVAVLCDTCMTHGKASGTLDAITPNTAVTVDNNGNFVDMRLKDIA